MVNPVELETLTPQQLVSALVEAARERGWGGAAVERRVKGVTAHDFSTWTGKIQRREPVVRIAPAKRLAILAFLHEEGVSGSGLHAVPATVGDLSDYPEDSPAEAIIRAFSDLANFDSGGVAPALEDVVLLAYARAFRERLPPAEMSKLDVWRNLVLGTDATPE